MGELAPKQVSVVTDEVLFSWNAFEEYDDDIEESVGVTTLQKIGEDWGKRLEKGLAKD